MHRARAVASLLEWGSGRTAETYVPLKGEAAASAHGRTAGQTAVRRDEPGEGQSRSAAAARGPGGGTSDHRAA